MSLHNLDVAIALAVVMLGVSLLITIFTQLIAMGLATRGRILRDGPRVLFETVYPDGAAHAETIANDVLTPKLISDSAVSAFFNRIPILKNYRLATAVRVEELIGILNRLAPAQGGPPNADLPNAGLPNGNITKESVIRELVRRARETLTPQLEAVTEQATAVLRKVHEATAAIAAPAASAGPGPGTSLSVDRLLQNIPVAAEVFLKPDSIKSWFNSAMDRASQKFVLKMRLITVGCSVIVAFALHLDTFRFLSQVSADPELRAGLVNASQTMQTQAAAVLKTASADRAQTTKRANKGTVQEKSSVNVPQTYHDALKTTVDTFQAKSRALANAGNIPVHVGSRELGERWLRMEMKDDPKREEAVTKYQLAVENGLKSDTDRLLDRAASIQGSLDYAGFKLIPDPYHEWDFWPATKGRWPLDNLHFWGIMFSAGLLSLGAPFWFNALKTLSSLRPVVASKVDREQKAA